MEKKDSLAYSSQIDILIEQCRADLVKKIQALVAIDSVESAALPGMPFGAGPAKALEQILADCRELGFATQNLDNYVGFADYGEGEPTLAVLSHVDTVPFGIGWTCDPLSGLVKEGRIYGRGTYDDKGPALTSLFALWIVKQLGLRPRGKIRLIFGANEETGMQDMVWYLKHQPQPDMAFSPDAPFPVINGEKGILDITLSCQIPESDVLFSIMGKGLAKHVPDAASVRLRLTDSQQETLRATIQAWPEEDIFTLLPQEDGSLLLQAHGVSSPATSPEKGRNAISILLDLLGRMDFLPAQWEDFVRTYNHYLGYDYTGKALGCASEDALGATLTLNVGELHYEDGIAKLMLHIRYPVLADFSRIEGAFSVMCGETGWSYAITRHMPAHYYPADSSLVTTLMNIFREETGLLEAEPKWMSGGTYARTLKNAVAFGPLFPGEPQRAHGPDEYVTIDSLLKAMRIYVRALIELGC